MNEIQQKILDDIKSKGRYYCESTHCSVCGDIIDMSR